MSVFAFDDASHTYTLGGARLPSVTQLIKGAGIGPDFSMIDPAVLEAKRAFGQAVHQACEFDDDGELDDDSTDARVMACVGAWRKFRADTGAAIVMNEQRLYHPTLRFAGTIDRLCYLRLKQEASASAWLVDLKTGVEPHTSYGVQLSGYAMLIHNSVGSEVLDATRQIDTSNLRRATVHLFDDGTYRFHQFPNPNDAACFMACIALHHWKESHQ